MATTGNKEPCHCGSGRAYVRCCYGADVLNAGGMDGFTFGQAHDAGTGSKKPSPNHFRAMMVSSDGLEALCGLSREQMYYLLYDPFSSPDLVSFNLEIRNFPDSQFFRLFHYLLKGVAAEELKPTTQGNLPVKFVNDAALWYYGQEEYRNRKIYTSFRTETDFPVLHTVRVVVQLSGFIRKYKSRFHLTKSGSEVLEKGLNGETFFKIFKAYTTRFNWAYNDRYPELPIVQQAFLFTLYLLARYGDTFRPASFYEDMFIAAFPEEVPNVPEVFLDTGEDTMKRCYSLRSLSRFAHFAFFWFRRTE